jgi:Ca-activated chloride channel family protein
MRLSQSWIGLSLCAGLGALIVVRGLVGCSSNPSYEMGRQRGAADGAPTATPQGVDEKNMMGLADAPAAGRRYEQDLSAVTDNSSAAFDPQVVREVAPSASDPLTLLSAGVPMTPKLEEASRAATGASSTPMASAAPASRGRPTGGRGAVEAGNAKDAAGEGAEPGRFDRDAGDKLQFTGTLGKVVEVAASTRPEPRFDEELWVIAKSDVGARSRSTNDDGPGSGAMVCLIPPVGGQTEPTQVPVPLKHTDVKASVTGSIASVEVTQKFQNPYDGKIEAVYVFPLPENAAVNDFVMTIGDRKIRGIIRERQQAEQIYTAARAQGYVASLMTQERPNIFTQKVANIEPGKSIDVSIVYFSTLSFSDGAFEFVFPMVVGPRFNPPASEGERMIGAQGAGIGVTPRGQPGGSGEKVEVQYLRPNQRSGHDISVALSIDAGVEIEKVSSPSHVIEVTTLSPSKADVRLGRADRMPNKDLVVRYTLAGRNVKSGVVVSRFPGYDGPANPGVAAPNDGWNYFQMMVVPPENLAALRRRPVEMVFVLDCSGSMNGEPLAQVKESVERVLRQLRPDDTFQVVRFSDSASAMGPKPLRASEKNIEWAIRHVGRLNSEGGTMMIEGIKASLDFPLDGDRERFVLFLTDGFIGNETEILTAIRSRLGPSHVFSVGVGSSVNRYLLDSMARVGRGAVAYIVPGDDPTQIIDRFFERVTRAAMTDITIDWGGMEVADVYPRRLPDLYHGRPVVVTGRFKAGSGTGSVTIKGRANIGAERGEDGAWARPIAMNLDMTRNVAVHPALPALWARQRIQELDEASLGEGGDGVAPEITRTALTYRLLSKHTAFVAVDSSRVTEGNVGTTVGVPVPVPSGVRYDTTVATPERR